VGGLLRHRAIHHPWLRPAKMALPLSRAWISTTEYTKTKHIRLTARRVGLLNDFRKFYYEFFIVLAFD